MGIFLDKQASQMVGQEEGGTYCIHHLVKTSTGRYLDRHCIKRNFPRQAATRTGIAHIRIFLDRPCTDRHRNRQVHLSHTGQEETNPICREGGGHSQQFYKQDPDPH